MRVFLAALVACAGCSQSSPVEQQPAVDADVGTETTDAAAADGGDDSSDAATPDVDTETAIADSTPSDSGGDTASVDTAPVTLTLPLFVAGSPYFDMGTAVSGGFRMNSSADKVTGKRTLPATHSWASWSATITVAPSLGTCAAELRLMVDGVSVPATIPKDAAKPYSVTISASFAASISGGKVVDVWLTRSGPDMSCGPITTNVSSLTLTAL